MLPPHRPLRFPGLEHAYASVFEDPDSVVHTLASPLARIVRWTAHADLMRTDSSRTSLHGSWFLSPEQHVVESAVVFPVCAWLLAWAWYGTGPLGALPALARALWRLVDAGARVGASAVAAAARPLFAALASLASLISPSRWQQQQQQQQQLRRSGRTRSRSRSRSRGGSGSGSGSGGSGGDGDGSSSRGRERVRVRRGPPTDGLLTSGARIGSLPFESRGKVRDGALARGADFVCAWGLAVSFAYIAVCKVITGRPIFMLMPCHLLTTALLAMHFAPRSVRVSDWATLMFNHYMSYTFMPVLAVALPDLRDYTLPFETVAFFAQHIFMIASPVLFILRRKFHIIRGHRIEIAAYAFGTAVFFFFLVPVSILNGVNLNYMLSPPPGILAQFGRAYRPVQMVLCIILLIISNVVHRGLLPSLADRLAPIGRTASSRDIRRVRENRSNSSGTARSTRSSSSRSGRPRVPSPSSPGVRSGSIKPRVRSRPVS
jgi:uncharacterized membrane protein YgcG